MLASGIPLVQAFEIVGNGHEKPSVQKLILDVKMDIEGSELKGLHGAAQVIKRDHPILAISAYHRQEDLIELPDYIKGVINLRGKIIPVMDVRLKFKKDAKHLFQVSLP